MYSLNRANKVLSLAAILLLSSCGGESNDNELSSEEKVQVSKTEFDAIASSEGMWLATFDMLTSFRSDFEVRNKTGNVSVDLTAFAVAPFYIETAAGESNITKGLCSVHSPVELVDESFENDFDQEFIADQLDSNLSLKFYNSFCAGDADITERYFNSSEDNYAIEYYCGEEKIGGLKLERMDNVASFSQGKLSFTSDTYPSLEPNNAPNGCGKLLEFDVITRSNTSNTDASFSYDMSSISVTADYLDSKIEMNFLFSSTLTLGDHEITSRSETIRADDSSKVAVKVSSAEFGGTSEYPMDMDASIGTVTVTEITDQSARGTYSFTTENGASFSGSFSFDYN